MGRVHYRWRAICESFKSIDVRHWYREGRLHADEYFSFSWTAHGQPEEVFVITRQDSVELVYQVPTSEAGQLKTIEQRVPITWTRCHFGEKRPWFVCPAQPIGRSCGRRVAVLYRVGDLFACRHCCDLVYASQKEAVGYRGVGRAQKIRMKLGGSPNLMEVFPDKPKGMHWRTYDRLREVHDIADERASMGLMELLGRIVLQTHHR